MTTTQFDKKAIVYDFGSLYSWSINALSGCTNRSSVSQCLGCDTTALIADFIAFVYGPERRCAHCLDRIVSRETGMMQSTTNGKEVCLHVECYKEIKAGGKRKSKKKRKSDVSREANHTEFASRRGSKSETSTGMTRAASPNKRSIENEQGNEGDKRRKEGAVGLGSKSEISTRMSRPASPNKRSIGSERENEGEKSRNEDEVEFQNKSNKKLREAKSVLRYKKTSRPPGRSRPKSPPESTPKTANITLLGRTRNPKTEKTTKRASGLHHRD